MVDERYCFLRMLHPCHPWMYGWLAGALRFDVVGSKLYLTMNYTAHRTRDKDLTLKLADLTTYLYASELLGLLMANVETLSRR